MIQKETMLTITDNSGAYFAQCISFFKSIKCDTVGFNEIIGVCLKNFNRKKFYFSKAGRQKNIKRVKLENLMRDEKYIYKAIILSCKRLKKRLDGSSVKTKKNRIVLITENWKLLGSRVYGPLYKELRKKKKLAFFKTLLTHAKHRI